MVRNKLLCQNSACPALEYLSVESDLLDNNTIMYILVTLFTNLELQKAESICKTIAAINVGYLNKY